MGGFLAGTKLRQTAAAIYHARYICTDSTSTIATGASELVVSYSNAQTTSSLVTASGTGNSTFTLNAAGIWFIECCIRVNYVTVPTSGNIFYYAYVVASSLQVGGDTISYPIYNEAFPQTRILRAFNAGDQIQTRIRN